MAPEKLSQIAAENEQGEFKWTVFFTEKNGFNSISQNF